MVEARRGVAADTGTMTGAVPARMSAMTANVVSLTQRRLMDPLIAIAGLPPDRRQAPPVSAYDELLNRRTARAAARDTSEEHTSHEHDRIRDPLAADGR